MLEDYIITPDQTPPEFVTPSDSIITYSEPIPQDMSWDSLLHCFVRLQTVA